MTGTTSQRCISAILISSDGRLRRWHFGLDARTCPLLAPSLFSFMHLPMGIPFRGMRVRGHPAVPVQNLAAVLVDDASVLVCK